MNLTKIPEEISKTSLTNIPKEIFENFIIGPGMVKKMRAVNKQTHTTLRNMRCTTLEIDLNKIQKIATEDELKKMVKRFFSSFRNVNLVFKHLEHNNIKENEEIIYQFLSCLSDEKDLNILSLKTQYQIIHPENLNFLKKVKRLDFSNSKESIEKNFILLPFCTNLESLNLYRGDKNFYYKSLLPEFLKINNSIRELNLCDNSLDIDILADAIAENTTLTALDISKNCIASPETIQKIIRKNSSLLILSLADCLVSSFNRAFFQLFESLQYNKTIIALNISRTILSNNLHRGYPRDKVIPKMCSELSENNTLQIFHLQYTLGLDELSELCNHLSRNTTLKVLNLEGNSEFGSPNYIQINKMLTENKSIISLSLKKCRLDVGLICKALRENTTIREINLSENFLYNVDIDNLCTLIETNETIRSLEMKKTAYKAVGETFITQSDVIELHTRVSAVKGANKSFREFQFSIDYFDQRNTMRINDFADLNSTPKITSTIATFPKIA